MLRANCTSQNSDFIVSRDSSPSLRVASSANNWTFLRIPCSESTSCWCIQ